MHLGLVKSIFGKLEEELGSLSPLALIDSGFGVPLDFRGENVDEPL